MQCVRPGVDLLIEVGYETAGEDFRALPTDPGLNPCPPGAVEIAGFNVLTQRPRTRQRPSNVFDQVAPITQAPPPAPPTCATRRSSSRPRITARSSRSASSSRSARKTSIPVTPAKPKAAITSLI